MGDVAANMLQEVGGCSACSGQSGGARKLSAYNKFMKGVLKKLKAAHPGKKAPELMKMAARKWREVRPVKSAKSASAKKPAAKKSSAKKSGRKTGRKSAKK
jgi:hypothetical protein